MYEYPRTPGACKDSYLEYELIGASFDDLLFVPG